MYESAVHNTRIFSRDQIIRQGNEYEERLVQPTLLVLVRTSTVKTTIATIPTVTVLTTVIAQPERRIVWRRACEAEIRQGVRLYETRSPEPIHRRIPHDGAVRDVFREKPAGHLLDLMERHFQYFSHDGTDARDTGTNICQKIKTTTTRHRGEQGRT